MESLFLENIKQTQNINDDQIWLLYQQHKLSLLSALDRNTKKYFCKKYQINGVTFEQYHAQAIGLSVHLSHSEVQNIYESTASLTQQQLDAAKYNAVIMEMSQYYRNIQTISAASDVQALDQALYHYEHFCTQNFDDFNPEDILQALRREIIDRPQHNELREILESAANADMLPNHNILEFHRKKSR